MIKSLRLVDFKSFADETLRMGPFTVVVGANASGKSNIRDAFRILHGIGRGYGLAEILGGRYGPGGELQWNPIRGAPGEIARLGSSSFALHVKMDLSGQARVRPPMVEYGIKIAVDQGASREFRVVSEKLTLRNKSIYTSHPPAPDPVAKQDDETHLLLRMAKTGAQRKYGYRVVVRPDQPALTQIREHKKVVRLHKEYAQQVIDTLANMRFLDLLPDRMRRPAFPGQSTLGDRGENLPTVLKEICEDRSRRSALVSWIRELTPMDVEDLKFVSDPTTGLIQLVFRETDDSHISAYSASDGTLRFLAVLAALLAKNPVGLHVFEEIDNGIHPSRLRLLLDLIESQTRKGRTQVVTTTHSPGLLSMVGDETFDSTGVVVRRPDATDSVIASVANLPDAKNLRASQGLGRLLESNWLEDAVIFTLPDESTDGS
ncbi:AAA family ATPase [Candidatus Palauibacter sp.]|uniref:AAA family ATPase n=1 Tax=Candidatus Palauibacter sp. TaxID=3101350 RepID=UPI003AF254E7